MRKVHSTFTMRCSYNIFVAAYRAKTASTLQWTPVVMANLRSADKNSGDGSNDVNEMPPLEEPEESVSITFDNDGVPMASGEYNRADDDADEPVDVNRGAECLFCSSRFDQPQGVYV